MPIKQLTYLDFSNPIYHQQWWEPKTIKPSGENIFSRTPLWSKNNYGKKFYFRGSGKPHYYANRHSQSSFSFSASYIPETIFQNQFFPLMLRKPRCHDSFLGNISFNNIFSDFIALSLKARRKCFNFLTFLNSFFLDVLFYSLTNELSWMRVGTGGGIGGNLRKDKEKHRCFGWLFVCFLVAVVVSLLPDDLLLSLPDMHK